MSIVTLRFFIFAGFILAEYWLCPPKWRWVMLLLGSGYFLLACTEYNLGVCAVFAAEALLTWLVALAIRQVPGERARWALTGLTVVVLAAVMILYKDIAFFINNINGIGSLLGKDLGLEMPQWLPAGCALGDRGAAPEKPAENAALCRVFPPAHLRPLLPLQ